MSNYSGFCCLPLTLKLYKAALHMIQYDFIISKCISDDGGTGEEVGKIKLPTEESSASYAFLDGETNKITALLLKNQRDEAKKQLHRTNMSVSHR